MIQFIGCLVGTLLGNFLYKYFDYKVNRIMFEYKASKQIERSWLE